MALRCDIGALRPAKRLADGRLRADAYISRVGVQEYMDARGKVRRELRLPEDVFHPDSLASFAQVPVTNDHPPKLLNARNARDYMVGSTGETVTRDDDHVRAPLMVADSDTIRQMEAGKREVSCGYTCDLDERPGVHPVYGPYDAIQRNIRGNHVAIVDSARAGKTARVRLDGAAVMVREDNVLTAKTRDKIPAKKFAVPSREALPLENAEHVRAAMSRFSQEKWQSDSEEKEAYHNILAAAKEYDIDASGFQKEYQRLDAAKARRGEDMDPEKLQETIRALGAQLTEEKARADAAEEKLKTEQTRADVAEGKLQTVEQERDAYKAQATSAATVGESAAVRREKERADSAEQKVARFDATLEKRVRERAKLERQAFAVMGNDFRMDDLNDREIMAAVVKRLDANADVSPGVADGIIQGRFLSLYDGHVRNARSQARVAEMMEGAREQAPRTDSKEEAKKALRDQWKKPLPNDIRARKEA